jgi:CHRD domain
MRAIPSAVLAAVALVALASGCGGGGKKPAGTTSRSTSTTTTSTTPASANGKVTVVSARLSAALVVPKKGPPGAKGTVVIRLDPKTQKACWTLALTGAPGALSAHVHFGKGKELGPVVIPLGDRYAARGCVLVPVRSLRAVASAPGSYYVDVHTRKYLDGAVRGPLHAGSG